MNPILRFLSRTSLWWIPALVALVSFGYVIGWTASTWAGDWWWGYNNVAKPLMLLVIVVAFASGWDAGRRGSGLASLREMAPVRRWRPEIARLLTIVSPTALVFLVGVVVLWVITLRHHGSPDPRIMFVALTHLLMLFFAGAIGVYFGRFLDAAVAAGASAACAAVLAFLSAGPGQQLFGMAGPGQIVGVIPSLSYFVWSGVVLLAITLLLVRPPSAVKRWRRGPSAFGGLVVAVIMTNTVFGPNTMFLPSNQPPGRCQSRPVEVCVFPGYDELGQAGAIALDEALVAAESQGVPRELFPERFVQPGAGRTTPPGVGFLRIPEGALAAGVIPSVSVADALSAPTWCPALYENDAPVAMLERRQLVLDWVLMASNTVTHSEFVSMHPKTVGLDGRQLALRVSNSLRDLSRCAT